jgi:putative polymerase
MEYAQRNPGAIGLMRSPAANSTNRYPDEWMIIAILMASITYQAFLCFLNTHFFSVSRALIGISETMIYLACLPILARRLLPGVLILALVAGATLCLLMLISGIYDAKPFRDLAIPFWFFWLGCNIGRRELADRALTYIIILVISLGLFEAFLLEKYTDIFNIFSYYVNTGNLAPITDYVRDSKLQLNGTRPEGIGRTLLPGLLGAHRVSSVFLEPVSLGNFAAMCAAWGLSRDKSDIRNAAFFVGSAVILVILADSRFALLSISIMFAVRFLLNGKALNLAILAPFAALILVIVVGINTHPSDAGDSFQGRLAWTGWSLFSFDVPMILGANNVHPFADQGYAHVLSTYGLPLALLLWFSFWFVPMPDDRSLRFRAFVSIYVGLILSISGFSLFALKSAGVLWFLMGCVLNQPAPAKPQRFRFSTTNAGTNIAKDLQPATTNSRD